MRSILFIIASVLVSVHGFAAEELFVDAAFKKAENSIIDLLRVAEPTLDSRYIAFQSEQKSGGFAVCCYRKRTMTVTHTKDKRVLGEFLVVVGSNYGDFQKGIVETTIVVSEGPYVYALWKCKERAEHLANELYGSAVTVENVDPTQPDATYALFYAFKVMNGAKQVAEIKLNSVECELQSLSFGN